MLSVRRGPNALVTTVCFAANRYRCGGACMVTVAKGCSWMLGRSFWRKRVLAPCPKSIKMTLMPKVMSEQSWRWLGELGAPKGPRRPLCLLVPNVAFFWTVHGPWQAVAGNLGVRKQLCEVGDITAAQASKWFRQAPDWQRGLTEEGIHPHLVPVVLGLLVWSRSTVFGVVSKSGLKPALLTSSVCKSCVPLTMKSWPCAKMHWTLGFRCIVNRVFHTGSLEQLATAWWCALFPHRTLSQRPAHGGVLSRSLSLPRNGVEILVRSSLRGPCMKSYNQIVSEVRTRQKLTGTP